MKVYLFLPRSLPIIRYTPPGGDSRMFARSYCHHFPIPHGASTPPPLLLLFLTLPTHGRKRGTQILIRGNLCPLRRSVRNVAQVTLVHFLFRLPQFQAAFCMEMPGGKKSFRHPKCGEGGIFALFCLSLSLLALFPCV